MMAEEAVAAVQRQTTNMSVARAADTNRREERLPQPDRGWAWVVAFACFVINFILAGLARSSGVLYVALIELYGISREAATTPFSIRVSVRNLSGPIVGMLGQRYGIRPVTILGGILAGFGGILSFFAPDISWLTFFWGGIHGIGFGFSTIIHMISINNYFDKYKGTAIGLGYSGDCIGTFVLPIVLEYLIATYGVKATFLLVGAIALNVVPMAMLLRPPPWVKKKKKNKQLPLGKVNGGFADSELSCSVVSLDQSQTTSAVKEHSAKNIVCATSQTFPRASKSQYASCIYDSICEWNFINRQMSDRRHGGDKDNRSTKNPFVSRSFRTADIPASTHSIDEDGDRNADDISSEFSTNPEHNGCSTNQSCSKNCESGSIDKRYDSITKIRIENINRNSGSLNSRSGMTATITDHGRTSETHIKVRALSETLRNRNPSGISPTFEGDKNSSVHVSDRKGGSFDVGEIECDIVEVNQEVRIQKVTGPVWRITYEKEGNSSGAKQLRNELCLDARNLKLDDGKRELEITTRHSQNGDIRSSPPPNIRNHFGRGIFKSLKKVYKANRKPIYILICMTFGVYALLFVSIVTVVIDFALDKGVPADNGKYLIIAFSAADLAGRLGFGVVIDKGWIEMKNYVGMTIVVMGLVVAVMPFAGNFLFLMLGMACYGFIQGGAAIIYPILVEKYMDKDEQSIAMGCLSFYGGLLMFAMAPMIGFFRDNYGSYDGMFYIDGIMTLSVGLIWFLEPLILKCQNRLSDRSKRQEIS